MEGSHDTECSKAYPCDQNEDEDDDENEDNDNGDKAKDGGSSSNSTVEENEKKIPVRPYIRSKMPRLRWTSDLHLRFIQAVERLGGHERATPKLVLQMMDIKGLNIAHVKSHLQMYRGKKIDDPGQHHRNLMVCGDRNIYNLSQLSILQGFTQRHVSTFRYGEHSFFNGYENWMHSPWTNWSDINKARQVYSSAAERIYGRNYSRDIHSSIFSFNGQSTRQTNDLEDAIRSLYNNGPWRHQSRINPIELNPLKKLQSKLQEEARQCNSSIPVDVNTSMRLEKRKMAKRKASDCELDLNLSLGLNTENGEIQRGLEDNEVCSNLSLSLYSPSSSKLISKSKDNESTKNARWASTLDLTI